MDEHQITKSQPAGNEKTRQRANAGRVKKEIVMPILPPPRPKANDLPVLVKTAGPLLQALDDAGFDTSNPRKLCCVFHGDTKASAGTFDKLDIDTETHWRYRCHGCGVFGDVFDIRAMNNGTTAEDELRKYRQQTGSQPQTTTKPRTSPPVTSQTIKASPRQAAYAKAAHARITPEDKQAYSKQLGVSVAALDAFGIGKHHRPANPPQYPVATDVLLIPMFNELMEIIGNRTRDANGEKQSTTGSRNGLFIPFRLPPGDELYSPEGPSDAAAIVEAGGYAVGRPSNAAGADLLVKFVQIHKITRVVVVIDRDPGEPAKTQTETAAVKLVQQLKAIDVAVCVIRPPEGHKDFRDWRNATGAGLDELNAQPDADLPDIDPQVDHSAPSDVPSDQPHHDATDNDAGREDGSSDAAGDDLFNDFNPLINQSRPALPMDAIPSVMRGLVEGVSQATEAPPELAFGVCLAVTSCVAQSRWRVVHESGHSEPLSTYVAPIGEPSERKTAQKTESAFPLVQWEKQERQRVAEANEANALEIKICDGRIKELEKSAAKAESAADRKALAEQIKQVQADMPPIETARRLIVDDVTPEHLPTMMAQNNQTLAIISDEGGSFFSAQAGRYSSGNANIDLVLKAWSHSSARINRANGKDIAMDSPALAIGVMLQPLLVQQLGENRDFMGRGFLDRFLWLWPESRLGYRQHNTQPMPKAARYAWRQVIGDLLKIQPAPDPYESNASRPHDITIDTEATQLWHEFQCEVEQWMRPGHQYHHMRQYCGKFPGQVVRIAGLFHCLASVDDATNTMPHHIQINRQTMQDAIAVGRCLMDHAVAVFGLMRRTEPMDRATKLWTWITRHDNTTFTGRDAWQAMKGVAAFPSTSAVYEGLNLLTEHGYIRGERIGKSDQFTVNPVALKADRPTIGGIGGGGGTSVSKF